MNMYTFSECNSAIFIFAILSIGSHYMASYLGLHCFPMTLLTVSIVRYNVKVDLHLQECYQVMPLEAISEEDWLILTLTLITTFRLVK